MTTDAQPLSLDDLVAKVEQTRDVPIDGLGLFRLQLLPLADKLDLIVMLDTVERDDQGNIASQRDAMAFGQHLLSRCLVDGSGNQCHHSDAGRDAIARMNLMAMQRLTSEAIELNGLGPGESDDELEDAKKN